MGNLRLIQRQLLDEELLPVQPKICWLLVLEKETFSDRCRDIKPALIEGP
jgi:hypothetical protein